MLSPGEVGEAIRQTGFGFMFAPAHHSAMKHVMPVRRELAVRTIFNFLGPLTNPAGATRQLLGVSDRHYQETIAEALAGLGCEHALVVTADDGLDEISISGRTRVIEVADGGTSEWFVEPGELGIDAAGIEAIAGGEPADNAATARAILAGEAGPTADIAVLGPVTTGREPVTLAKPTTEKGDDVYLVGYPGETEEEPEVTISSGIVSRLRTDKVFELSYVQTDASIAGGQSGGALADEAGRVIGVSGSSIGDDKFALALDGDDVQAAVDRILAGKGAPYWTFPSNDPEAGKTSGDVHLRSADDGLALPRPQESGVSAHHAQRCVAARGWRLLRLVVRHGAHLLCSLRGILGARRRHPGRVDLLQDPRHSRRCSHASNAHGACDRYQRPGLCRSPSGDCRGHAGGQQDALLYGRFYRRTGGPFGLCADAARRRRCDDGPCDIAARHQPFVDFLGGHRRGRGDGLRFLAD